MNIFNSRGDLNASSLKDAFQTISKFASVLEDGMPSNQTLSGPAGLSDMQRDQLIAQAMMTNDGKIALAQAMANPK